jgi:transcriptional regulator with XRE-family HTH domain
MGFEAQRIKAPDGTDMVILKASDYEDLLTLAEDGGDRAAAAAVLERIAGGEGTIPDHVMALMLDDGLSPLAAWRRYRGLSQAEIARRTGLSQVWIGRMEAGGGVGSSKTRHLLARALDAPQWAFDPADGEFAAGNHQMAEQPRKPCGRKYRPLAEWLSNHDAAKITLSFDDIGRLVGGLPRSAYDYQPWWQNNRGNGQALGWRTAGYVVTADLQLKTATFERQS